MVILDVLQLKSLTIFASSTIITPIGDLMSHAMKIMDVTLLEMVRSREAVKSVKLSKGSKLIKSSPVGRRRPKICISLRTMKLGSTMMDDTLTHVEFASSGCKKMKRVYISLC